MLVTLLNGCSGQHYPPNTQYVSHSIDDKDNPPAPVASSIKSLTPAPSSGADNAPSELSSLQTIKESALPVSNNMPLKRRKVWDMLANDQHFADKISHQRIENYISQYKINTLYFKNIEDRILRYMPYIAAQLKERNLPPELIVLPLVESTYNPFAYSSRNAAGLWQFMRPTAKYLGIQQNWWYDGRRDTIASTDAALRYLTYLHDRFSGDWLLALAAYNSGEGTVKKAIRSNHAKGLPTDYWTLNLPSETRAYVPRFLAMTKILSKPEHYDLKLPELYEEINFDLIKLGERIDLIQAALLANISAEEFYKLNPGFLRTTSPPHGPFTILLPKGTEPGFRARLAASPKSSWQPAQRHIVQPGDTLSEIAESYHLTIKSLVYTNKLRSTGIREGQILKIPTGISTNQSALPAFVNAQHRYRVRKGDTLSGIAAKHRISTSALARWNKWPLSKLLIPGQKLMLYPRS